MSHTALTSNSLLVGLLFSTSLSAEIQLLALQFPIWNYFLDVFLSKHSLVDTDTLEGSFSFFSLLS